jgi:periplasmic divalent cation tolerance protein
MGPAEPAVHAVLVTAPDAESAERLATALVEERLAACANLVSGVTSIYRWEGKLERAGEVLLILKTSEARLPELLARVAELHPYEVPEVLALPVRAGYPPYLRWVDRETAAARPGEHRG